jgi:hypothetical protein
MKVRLGVVAPRRSLGRFEGAASTLTGCEPRWMLYDSEDGIPSVVAKGVTECDALCFSGDMPHERSRDVVLPPEMPVEVVRLTAVDITLCLLRARALPQPIAPLSIDTVSVEIMDEIVEQLGLDPNQVAHLPHDRDLDVDDIVRFHRDAHERLATSIAVTGRSNAEAALAAQLDIPVFPAVPVTSSIRAAMNRAVLAAANRRQADKNFAAAIFRTVVGGDLVESETRRLAMAHALHEVVDLSDAWVEARSGGQDVLVFGHRRLMQRLTHDWTALPLAHELERRVGQPIAIGIGLGGSARRSVEYAEAAINRSVRAGGRCGFVVSEEGVVIGPMSGMSHPPQTHMFRFDDEALAEFARDMGFGVATVSRLLNYEQELAGAAVSASDLARQLKLSAPSGRRVARVLDQHGLLIAAGTAQTTGRGRPTTLFRLNLRARLADAVDTTESSASVRDAM